MKFDFNVFVRTFAEGILYLALCVVCVSGMLASLIWVSNRASSYVVMAVVLVYVVLLYSVRYAITED